MKVLEMTPELFKFRRRIIKLLYEARDLLGIADMARIKVRIVEFSAAEQNTLGQCWFTKDFIVIAARMEKESENILRQVVWHELAHAWFEAPHVAGCPLMNASLIRTATKAQLVKALKKLPKERKARTGKMLEEVTQMLSVMEVV